MPTGCPPSSQMSHFLFGTNQSEEMNSSKDKIPELPQTQSQPRLTYRSPRLTAYGRLHTLVESGSGRKTENMGQMGTDRRP